MERGRLTWEAFLYEIQTFYTSASLMDQGWQLLEYEEGNMVYKYLRKVELTPKYHADSSHISNDNSLVYGNIVGKVSSVEDDEDANSPVALLPVFSKEYHIIYSESYNVPVLFFNVCHSDGTLLDHNEILQLASSQHRDVIGKDIWSALSQQEHPYLHRPFYVLHPCRTAHVMSQVRADTSSRYLVQWLSSFGPAAGLRLPIEMASLTREEANATTDK